MIVPLVLLQTSPAVALIDRCMQIHVKLKSASVTVTTREASGKTRSVDVAFVTPDRARIRILTPASGMTSASDRTFTLMRDKVYGYDKTVNEWLVKSISPRGSMAERISAAVGQLEHPTAFMLAPKALAEFLAPMKKVPGWAVSRNSAEVTISTSIASVGQYRLKFAAGDGRILGIYVKTDRGVVDWKYRYGAAPASLSFSKPASAAKVTFFKDRQRAPSFADAQAKKLYTQAVNAYGRISPLSYSVTDDSGKWVVNCTRKGYTQSGPGYFSWTGGQLVAGTGSRRKTEKCSSKDLPHRLSALSVPVEPTLRIMLLGFNPFERMMTGLKVRSAGSISVGGVKFSVLEGSKAGYRLTVQVRSDNYLMGGSISEQVDARGNALNRTERRFTYK